MLGRLIILSILVLGSLMGIGYAADGTTASEQLWAELLDDAFAGVELTDSQNSHLQAILDQAARDRARYTEIVKRLKTAREGGDLELVRTLSAEGKELGGTLRAADRLKSMATFLDENQVLIFERNLRLRQDRLRAEKWASQAEKNKPVEEAGVASEVPSE